MPGQLVRNKQVRLKHYVLAALKETDLEVVSSDFILELKEDNEDDVLVKNLYLSCDPYMRIRMSGLDISHTPPFKTGQVIYLTLYVRFHHGQYHCWQYLFPYIIYLFTSYTFVKCYNVGLLVVWVCRIWKGLG